MRLNVRWAAALAAGLVAVPTAAHAKPVSPEQFGLHVASLAPARHRACPSSRCDCGTPGSAGMRSTLRRASTTGRLGRGRVRR